MTNIEKSLPIIAQVKMNVYDGNYKEWIIELTDFLGE